VGVTGGSKLNSVLMFLHMYYDLKLFRTRRWRARRQCSLLALLQVESLNRALERIRQGTYGVCAECGGDIEPKRLEAIPWARYCVTCQEARERTRPA
jgi:RNA polymerase-binding transcription factor DksA